MKTQDDSAEWLDAEKAKLIAETKQLGAEMRSLFIALLRLVARLLALLLGFGGIVYAAANQNSQNKVVIGCIISAIGSTAILYLKKYRSQKPANRNKKP